MLSPGRRVRENTAGAKHGIGSSEGGGDAREARAGAQAASEGGGDDVFDDEDLVDEELVIKLQVKVGIMMFLMMKMTRAGPHNASQGGGGGRPRGGARGHEGSGQGEGGRGEAQRGEGD